jgi:hypothetical protein
MLESLANFSNKYPFFARILYYYVMFIHFICYLYLYISVYFTNSIFYLSILLFIIFCTILQWVIIKCCFLRKIENALSGNKPNKYGNDINIFIKPLTYLFDERIVYNIYYYFMKVYLLIVVVISLYKINKIYANNCIIL